MQVIDCGFSRWDDNKCSVCIKDDKQKKFYDQWTTDRDGYSRCSTCDVKCEEGEVPKHCECTSDEYLFV